LTRFASLDEQFASFAEAIRDSSRDMPERFIPIRPLSATERHQRRRRPGERTTYRTAIGI